MFISLLYSFRFSGHGTAVLPAGPRTPLSGQGEGQGRLMLSLHANSQPQFLQKTKFYRKNLSGDDNFLLSILVL
jgi:hypothetical protein